MAFSFVLLLFGISSSNCMSQAYHFVTRVRSAWFGPPRKIHPVRTLSNDLLNIHEHSWTMLETHGDTDVSKLPTLPEPAGQVRDRPWQANGNGAAMAVSFQAITAVLPTCYAMNCYDLIAVFWYILIRLFSHVQSLQGWLFRWRTGLGLFCSVPVCCSPICVGAGSYSHWDSQGPLGTGFEYQNFKEWPTRPTRNNLLAGVVSL